MARRMRTDERTDTDLVVAALAGDRDAVAGIYDRYATVIFTVCVRLLGNRDDAADCAGDVFLRATERLHQLREPEKLKPWLYAIARNEVARRQRRRGREVLVHSIDDLPWIPGDDPGFEVDVDLAVDRPGLVGAASGGHDRGAADPTGAAGPAATLELLLQEASAGLTDRDRAVAELGLRQNLQGDELAAALGVTTNHAYVLVHRVRARLEQAITAILVARTGRDDCAELQKILAGWDGDLTVLLRKRVSRHIDRCDICGTKRKLVPATLFSGAPVLAAPIAIRQRVLGDAQVASATGRPWSSDGFPRTSGGRRRTLWLSGAAAAIIVIALLAVVVTGRGDGTTLLAERTSDAATSTSSSQPDSPSADSVLGGIAGSVPDPTSPDAPAPDVTEPGDTTSTTGGGVGPGQNPPNDGGPGEPPVNGGGDPQPPPVGPGSLVASPAALDFGAAATTQQLVLANTGGTSLPFGLSGSSGALSVSPASGSVAPGTSQVVIVGLNRAGLGDLFSASLIGQAGGIALSIPVSATNSQAPVITSVSGPAVFGPGNNPNCAIDVEVTDNTGVVEVRVVFVASPPITTEYTALLVPTTPGHWGGRHLDGSQVTYTPGTWYVVARDAAGNEARSAPMLGAVGFVCVA